MLRNIFCYMMFLLLFFLGFSADADDVDRGKLLYENHCGGCHTQAVHQRENRKVDNLVDLSKMIIRWQYHLKLEWSVEEVRHVMAFLNKRYYKLNLEP